MGIAIVAAVLFLTVGGQTIAHPELSEPFTPGQYEAYEPKAGPGCHADPYAVRSDCAR